MPRIKSTGASLETPALPESELRRVLSDLTNRYDFGDRTVHTYYLDLASIIGRWRQQREELTVTVATTLLRLADNLEDAAQTLRGTETAIRTSLEIAVASRVLQMMERDPTIGSGDCARNLLSSFCDHAESISHVCRIAAADLPRGADKRGPKGVDWYEKFTSLLLTIAEKSGVQPTLYKDRASHNAPTGWLLEAARQLEAFLPKEMRSSSAVARYKRLERS